MNLLSRWSAAEIRAYKTASDAYDLANLTNDPTDHLAADKAGTHLDSIREGYNAEIRRRRQLS